MNLASAAHFPEFNHLICPWSRDPSLSDQLLPHTRVTICLWSITLWLDKFLVSRMLIHEFSVANMFLVPILLILFVWSPSIISQAGSFLLARLMFIWAAQVRARIEPAGDL